MATDPRKRQKKLERRAGKRKEKKHALVRGQSAGLPGQLTAAARCPVVNCWMTDSLQKEGIGWVVLSRELPNRQVAVANFLVDPYCLGVKNVFVEVLPHSDYDSKYLRKMTKEMPSRSVALAEARKFLEEAVAYAKGLGLPPHADYARGLLLFGNVSAAESDAVFEFGKDGQPYFIAGPNDTPERCRQIMTILNHTCGPDGFHYLTMVGGGDLMRALPGGASPEDIDLIGPVEEFFDDEDDLIEDG